MLPFPILLTGTQAAYAFIGETKLWLFSNGVSMECTFSPARRMHTQPQG